MLLCNLNYQFLIIIIIILQFKLNKHGILHVLYIKSSVEL